jgi:hypothetical protein
MSPRRLPALGTSPGTNWSFARPVVKASARWSPPDETGSSSGIEDQRRGTAAIPIGQRDPASRRRDDRSDRSGPPALGRERRFRQLAKPSSVPQYHSLRATIAEPPYGELPRARTDHHRDRSQRVALIIVGAGDVNSELVVVLSARPPWPSTAALREWPLGQPGVENDAGSGRGRQ